MRGPQYDSSEEGWDALVGNEISRELVEELFNAVESATDSLVEKYGLEEEVDREVVNEHLKIAFAEAGVLFLEEGIWSGDVDVRRIIREMNEDLMSNTRLMVGRVASRHRDLMYLSGAILKEAHTRD